MEVRLRLPGAVYRRAASLAEARGVRLQDAIAALVTLYADAQIDPLRPDPIASAYGRRQALRGAHGRTAAERSAAARRAVTARWAQRDDHR